VFSRAIFGGALYDDNGYRPFQPPLGLPSWRWDVNVIAFTVLTAIMVAGVAPRWRRDFLTPRDTEGGC
jgi:hypothetical protein